MADAAASKAAVRKGVRVRVPLRARHVPRSEDKRGCGNRPVVTDWSQVSLNTVYVLIGVVAAAITIVTTVTKSGKQVRRRLVAWIRRRPVPPRTHVHVEPDTRFCIWSQAPAPHADPIKHVTFQMRCVMTNSTPSYDVRVVGVELRGVEGKVHWESAQIFESTPRGSVLTDVLPANEPTHGMLIVVLEREALPSGPHTALMVVRDHLGNRFRSPKTTFKDGNIGSPDGPTPPSPAGTITTGQPDLSDRRTVHHLGYLRERNQVGSPIEPPRRTGGVDRP